MWNYKVRVETRWLSSHCLSVSETRRDAETFGCLIVSSGYYVPGEMRRPSAWECRRSRYFGKTLVPSRRIFPASVERTSARARYQDAREHWAIFQTWDTG